MIGVEEALRRVLEHAQSLPPATVSLAESLGQVVAEDIASDTDSPPHDKSVVDGYAVQVASAGEGAELDVLEEVVAGAVPSRVVSAGMATRIMTGAPIPSGADAVVMVERTELVQPGSSARVRILQAPKLGQNIMRQAVSMRRGQIVLHAGQRLDAIEIGLLAEVGRQTVSVTPKPTLAILATGNELVEGNFSLQPGQIRNSNGPMLTALACDSGARGISLGIARDERAELRSKIDQGLQSDILVLSGGVSEGVLDLVPQVLAEAGVTQVFHKVHLKPGKPIWFGVQRKGSRNTLVFGLPGNPVSSLVCFQLFVLPAIQALAGQVAAGLPRVRATLQAPHFQRGDRPTYWPVAWDRSVDGRVIQPLLWHGSGDLCTLAQADGLALFARGERTYELGEGVEVLYWR